MLCGRVDGVTIIFFALMLALLSGCGQSGVSSTANKIESEPRHSAPDIESIGNATFSGIFDQPLTLASGRWEGEPFVPGGASRPTAGLSTDFYLSGDINGDGQDEAVVIVWGNSGGTGTYIYVAVVGWWDGIIENIGTAPIGDRVQIRSGHLDTQQIVLQVLQQGPDDAACCPSQKATRTWLMTATGLHEGGAVIEGDKSSNDP